MTIQRLTLLQLYGLALLTSALGCSDGGGNDNQANGPDAALANKDCYLGLQVPGVSHSGFACSGADSSSSVSGLAPNSFDAALTVSLSLSSPPAIGRLDLSSLTVTRPEGGVSNDWDAQIDSCNATATKSALDTNMGWNYFLIDIACSLPALPVDNNPGQPLELGNFSIVTFFTSHS